MKLDKRLLELIGPARLAFYLTISLGVAGGVLIVVQAWLLSRVIEQVFLNHAGLSDVLSLLVASIALYICRAAAIWGVEVAGNQLAVKVKHELRAGFIRQVQSRGPNFLWKGSADDNEDTGALVNAATEGIEALDAYFSQYVPQIVLAALIPLTYLAVVLSLDPLSGIILLLTAPLIPAFMILIGDLADGMTQKRWQTLRRMNGYFLDVLQGLTTLKMLGRSREQIKVIARLSERFRETTMDVLRVAFLSALALELIATLSTAIIAVEIGLRLLSGRLLFQQALFILLLAPEFYLPLRLLGTRFHAGMAGMQAAGEVFSILEGGNPTRAEKATADSQVRPDPAGQKSAIGSSPIDIRFEGVSFSYADGREALYEASFDIPAGSKAALVGPSGSGKTTVAYLLLALLEPQAGEIKVNGQPREKIAEAQWLREVSWMPQNPYLFNETVEANIRLGRAEAKREEVIRAAKLAQAHNFIEALPEGYLTVIGERGVRLSAGQAKRIALARAFLKDAPVLILDEASANLDPDTETVVHEAISELARGRTTLLIAHRLRTVQDADQIIVMDRGRVQTIGKHASLLESNRLYREMVNAHGMGAHSEVSAHARIRAHKGNGSGDESNEPGTGGERWPKQAMDDHEGKSQPSFRPATRQNSTSRPSLSSLRTITRLLELLAPFKVQVALATLLAVATIASGIGLLTTSAYIISAAALQPSIAALQVPIAGVRFFGLSRGIFRYLERYVSHNVTFHLLARLRTWLYEKIEPLAPAGLIDRHSGDLLGRVTADIEALENFFVRSAAPPLAAAVVAGLATAVMVQIELSLGMVLLLFLALAGAGVPMLVQQLGKEPGKQLVRTRSRLSTALVDGIQGLADLKVLGGDAEKAQEVINLSQDVGRAQKRMGRLKGTQEALVNLAANLGAWSVLVLAIPLVAGGKIEGVYLAVLLLGAMSCFEAVAPLPAAAQYLESNLEAARRLFALADTQPEVKTTGDALRVTSKFDLVVQDLSFEYSSSTTTYSISANLPGIPEPRTLKGISFCLREGGRVAIVGPSGAGKTTLVNLLLRFWEYREGNITLGGEDLCRYDAEQLREHMAVIAQNTYLFNTTVRENLLLANPRATEREIIQAAERAQIHDFIQALPKGYDTWIGEQGLRLSAGQRQRIAIARALLKDASLLILDEPTANLDPLTERAVLKTILQSMEKRTILMITHRLVGMEAMDEILVLNGGRIVEQGKHEDLLTMGCLYRRMWDLQSEALGDGRWTTGDGRRRTGFHGG